jgi:hypothetical protein
MTNVFQQGDKILLKKRCGTKLWLLIVAPLNELI